jgi:WD domain, G-beta repeat/BTB/POZ domain
MSMIKLELRGKIFTVDRNILMNVKGTYFDSMLSSSWQPNADGVYVIDQPHEGFDRILDCLATGKINCKGLTDHEIECVYYNLDYFLIPFTRVWDYSIVNPIEHIVLHNCIQIKDGRLCGSKFSKYWSERDYSIKIWNMDTNIMERSLEGHTSDITCIIHLRDGRICSSSQDKSIKIWNTESGVCELTCIGHTDMATCVIQLIDGRLCSSSKDSTIQIWRSDTGVCELRINTGYRFCIVQLRDGRICSGDSLGNMNIWNITTGLCEMALDGHFTAVTAIVVIDELRVCSCSMVETVNVWNVSSGVCERALEPLEGVLRGLHDYVADMVLLFDGRLCGVLNNKSMQIWNVERGVCELRVTVTSSLSLERVIQLHDGRLVISDSSGLLYIAGA